MTPPSSTSRCALAAALTHVAVFAGLASTALAAHGQSLSSSVDIGIAGGNALAGPSASALLLQPSIRWDHPNTSFGAQASWLAGPQAHLDGDASIGGRYFSPVYRHLRFELGASAERTAGPDVIASSNALLGDANLSLSLGAGGLWISRGQRASATKSLPSQVRTYGAGTWRRVGGAVFTASVTASSYGTGGSNGLGGGASNPGLPTADSLGNIIDTLSRTSSVARQYADLESSVYWSHGALALDGLLGTRVSASYGQRATWGRAQASWSLNEQFALVAAGGTRAPEPSVGRVGGNFVSLGVRLASAPWIAHALHGARSSASAFGVRAEDSTRIIYVHAPAARTVELMADFTDWQPVIMRHAANDEWELAMFIAPGSHRVNIRVDGGEWSAPPGAGTVQDEFNGTVGLMVVP
ncbi:MAG TPA: glycogen-binding domain-containing protein [Gemmatimonadaceae bacterium]